MYKIQERNYAVGKGFDVKRYLEDLENRIDPAIEDDIFIQWRHFLTDGAAGQVFLPKRNPVEASKLEYPVIMVNDAINDSTFESMLLAQIKGVNDLISSKIGAFPAIRANYGCNIIPSLFGCKLHMMEKELNTLPGAYPLSGGTDMIRKCLAQGVPDMLAGQGKQVFDCVAYFIDSLRDYPKLKKYCHIYHPDAQGVLDISEVIYGSEIFLAFYDEPALMHKFLDLILRTYTSFMDNFFKLVPPEEDFNCHYGWLHRGKIRMSLDSCVNFSPEMYEEFSLPYDKILLNSYGGIIHSCGKVDHFVNSLNMIGEGYHGFNLSQPHLNDMEKVFAGTVDKGVRIFSLNADAVRQARGKQRKLHGLVHAAP
jgi:hypothetical protein